MKNYYKNIKKIAGLAGLSMLIAAGLVSCDTSGLTDTLDDFGVLIELEPVNTSATVQLVDAATGELISSDVTATFGGENGSDIIDIYSDPIDQREVGDGILNFGIDNSVTPSESNPAEVQLRLQANGYVSALKTVEINTEGNNDFTIRMVRENNKPQGVTSTSNTEGAADDQGTVQEDFSVTSDSETEADAGASVEVESGTVFKDASGNNLSGQLTSSLSYYTPSEVSAMESIPVEFEDDEGNPFVLAGASTVSVVDQNGRRAATAETNAKAANNDGPVSYVFKISSSATNPSNNNAAYAEGDAVTIFVLDEDFNNTEIAGTVSTLNSGSLGVVFNSTTVPNFVMIGNPVDASSYCSTAITINRNGNGGNLNFHWYTTGYSSYRTIYSGSNTYNLSRAYNQELNYRITTATGTVAGSQNFCENTAPIDLPAPSAETIDATIEVGLTCPDKQNITVTDVPSASILYRRAGSEGQGRAWRSATNIEWDQDEANNGRVEGGSFDVSSVIDGQDYNFTIKIDDENRTRTVTIDGDPTTYTEEVADICE